jgi:hypothetical protein
MDFVVQCEDGLGARLEGFGDGVRITLLLRVGRYSPSVTRACSKEEQSDDKHIGRKKR